MRARFALLAFVLLGCPGPAPSDAGRSDVGPLDAPRLDDASTDAGGDDGGGSDAPIIDGDLSRDFCAPLAAFICGSADECGCGVLVPGGELDLPACIERWTERCMTSWQPFVDAGARIDGEAASACIDAVTEGTTRCAQPDGATVFAVCAPFAIEPVAIGEACMTPYCANGEGTCVAGTCVARGAAGDPCSTMFFCATGLVCNEGTCTALAAEDAACDVDLDCAPPLRCTDGACAPLAASGTACSATSGCAIGLTCDDGTCVAPSGTCPESPCGNRAECGGARTCAPRAGAGTACSDDRDCEAALYCDGTCTARPADGEACARGTVCAAGLGCDTDGGTCRPLPGDGAACAFGEMGPVCADGFACIDGSSCGPLPGEGEPCAGANLCAEGLGCDFTPEGSFCIVPRGEGGACESDRSCAEAFHCEGTSCAADRAAGQPCSVGNECAGVCGPDASGGFSCRDAPVLGDGCVFSDECPLTLRCVAESPVCLPEICRGL